MKTLLRLENIKKTYYQYDSPLKKALAISGIKSVKPNRKVEALKGVNLELLKGEAIGLLGKNGSGKSTLLEIVSGTSQQTSGKVEVNGSVYPMLELGAGFNPKLSGRKNIELLFHLQGIPEKSFCELFDRVLEFSEIEKFIDQPVYTYSSGMQMRLAFSMLLASEPDILIIDEALAVGDYFFQKKCYELISDFLNNGGGMLLVSHDHAIMRNICSKALVLENGNCIYQGDVVTAISRYLERVSPSKNITKTNDKLDKKKVYISGVEYEGQGRNVGAKIELGCNFSIKVRVAANEKAQCHVNLMIRNQYGSLINITSTLSKKMDPLCLLEGETKVVEFTFKLMIEAGTYSVQVSLSSVERNFLDNITYDLGEELGPITVIWESERKVAPFYGQFGVPASVRVIENTVRQKNDTIKHYKRDEWAL